MYNEEEEEEEYDRPEEDASLLDCTCDHDPEGHNGDGCTIEGCDCQGHWEY